MSYLSGLILLFSLPANAANNAWSTLASIHPASSKATTEIKALMENSIELSGFAILDENSPEDLKEFLFTSTHHGCIHDPLPSPNKLIYVRLSKGKLSPTAISKKIKLNGKINISSRSDASYEMVAELTM